MSDRPVFYYDLSSPECWLVAERINAELCEVPVWQPVLASALREDGADEAAVGDERHRRADVERRAQAQGLPAVRWPSPFPADTELVVRAAVFAQASGRAVAFSLAAFRQAFAAGRDLGDLDNVLFAAAACELHPRAVLKGIETRSIRARAETAAQEAIAAGVRSVPALRSGGTVRSGDEVLACPGASEGSKRSPSPLRTETS